MKLMNTSTLKIMSAPIRFTLVNNKGVKKVSNKINQNNTPKEEKQKEIRRGINMTDEQRDFAQKIKNDIVSLYCDEGFSIRMIASHYNELYSIKDKRGNILKEAISRETIRKILNNEEVSLKTIIGNPNFIQDMGK